MSCTIDTPIEEVIREFYTAVDVLSLPHPYVEVNFRHPAGAEYKNGKLTTLFSPPSLSTIGVEIKFNVSIYLEREWVNNEWIELSSTKEDDDRRLKEFEHALAYSRHLNRVKHDLQKNHYAAFGHSRVAISCKRK